MTRFVSNVSSSSVLARQDSARLHLVRLVMHTQDHCPVSRTDLARDLETARGARLMGRTADAADGLAWEWFADRWRHRWKVRSI